MSSSHITTFWEYCHVLRRHTCIQVPYSNLCYFVTLYSKTRGPWGHLKSRSQQTQEWFVPGLVEIGNLAWEIRKFLKVVNIFLLFCYHIPMRKGRAFNWKKSYYHIMLYDIFGKYCLSTLLNIVNVFSKFCYYLSLEKENVFICTNLNPFYQWTLWAKFEVLVWIWKSGKEYNHNKNKTRQILTSEAHLSLWSRRMDSQRGNI